MALVSTKESTQAAYPKTILSIAVSVGGLAVFLIIASTVLVSQPVGSTIRAYFYGVDRSRNVGWESSVGSSVSESNHTIAALEDRGKSNSSVLGGNATGVISQHGVRSAESTDDEESLTGITPPPLSQNNSESSDSGSEESDSSRELKPTVANVTWDVGGNTSSSSASTTDAGSSSQAIVDSGGCDLYHGKWIYDPVGPLYSNDSCPVLTQTQNCRGNGRQDKDYENWRWKPSKCDLPRFDPKKFLELMRGKTLAFIGDSVARNQMESMLCILWQFEAPINRGNKRMQRYYFRSTSTMVVRIWSSWLVHQTSEPFDYAPAGVVKLHLDAPDEGFMQYITSFDVVVLSSGHWFAKQSVYILNSEIVGGQLWWPDRARRKKVDNIEAFGISVETILTAMARQQNYTGLTIVRSFSPDHYEGGAWNTGGSCTGKVRPASDAELVENGFTNIMYEKQAMGFRRAVKKKSNKSTMKLMDITKAFSYRVDGHPGPYRSPDPNKKTTRGPDGKPPPQDCLHWCMPGPVDTWNELVFEIIRREFSNRQDTSA